MNYPNKIVKAGETNKTIVKAVQQRLNEVGVGPVEVIGIYGPKTTNAVFSKNYLSYVLICAANH